MKKGKEERREKGAREVPKWFSPLCAISVAKCFVMLRFFFNFFNFDFSRFPAFLLLPPPPPYLSPHPTPILLRCPHAQERALFEGLMKHSLSCLKYTFKVSLLFVSTNQIIKGPESVWRKNDQFTIRSGTQDFEWNKVGITRSTSRVFD